MGRATRTSRAERRMHKERAASALKHGLPAPGPRSSKRGELAAEASSPPVSISEPPASLPLPVKLLGLGLLILGLTYGLTLFRDRRASAPRAPLESERLILGTSPQAAPSPSAAVSGAAIRSVPAPK